LQKARADQMGLALEIEDTDFAIAEAQRQREQLQAERQQAQDHETRQRRREVGEQLKEQSRFLSGSCISHVKFLVEHAATLREFIALTAQLNEPTKHLGLKHFRRFWEASLHAALPFEYSKQPEIYRGDYEAFLTEQVNNVGNIATEPSSETVEETKTA
jgi:hypothetical protein